MGDVLTFPPKQPRTRPVRHHAYRPGTWVTGYTPYGMFGITGHRDHLFIISSEPVGRSYSGTAGYTQDVKCLFCGVRILDVAGDFIQVMATEQDIREFHDYVKEWQIRLRKVQRLVVREITQ